MITAIVTAKIPEGMTRDQWLANSQRIADRFRTVPGLVRKQFLYGENGIGGGVYLWESREAAEACYRGIWRDNFKNTFGTDPDIQFFESPVIVDNAGKAATIAA